eukprot:Clim_evm6s167 gene=Clim_evmTU6s167
MGAPMLLVRFCGALVWIPVKHLFGKTPVKTWGVKLDLGVTILRILLSEKPSWAKKVAAKLAAKSAKKAKKKGFPMQPVSDAKGFTGYWIGDESCPGTVCLYAHGGGYASQSSANYAGSLASMCDTARGMGRDLTFLALEYTLSSDGAPYPTQVVEAVAAYVYLTETVGVKPENIVLAGDSAGSHLALSTVLKLREQGLNQPSKCVYISPWVDLTAHKKEEGSMKEHVNLDYLHPNFLDYCAPIFAGDVPLDDEWISPIKQDMKDLPPAMFIWGGIETLEDSMEEFWVKYSTAVDGCVKHVNPIMPHIWMFIEDVILAHKHCKEGRTTITTYMVEPNY